MKRASLLVLACGCQLALSAAAPVLLEIRQNVGQPVNRLVVTNQDTSASTNGALAFGGLAVPTNVVKVRSTYTYAGNAETLDLPRGRVNGRLLVLASARIGAAYLGQNVSFLFGDEIPVPLTDEKGDPASKDYWRAEPHRQPTLEPGDITDLTSLARRMADTTDDTVSKYVRDRLPSETRTLLDTYNTTNPPTPNLSDELRTKLADGLNTLITGVSIYDTNRFSKVSLSPETRDLANKVDRVAGETARLNRLLLEDSYPEGLARPAPYYWSPHAGKVYAVQAGQVSVVWRKKEGIAAIDGLNPKDYVLDNGSYYRLHKQTYLVSGSTVKPVRRIYWTEGVFRDIGKQVVVPAGRVHAVNIVYNNDFPRTVRSEYQALGQSSPTDGQDVNRLANLRTLYVDENDKNLHAYNLEGKVFVELLGDSRGDNTRRQLAIEIVEVIRQPNPSDVTVELGERLTAFPGGQPEDSHLYPEPLGTSGTSFAYRHQGGGADQVQYYAAAETRNANDLLVHWLEEGEAGLRWPFRFVRYELVWPTNVKKYSHYIRPVVAKAADAKATAIPLPQLNAPFIQFQDTDIAQADWGGHLTETFAYYSYLTQAKPAHRALLRFTAGEHVRFERVFSWLDDKLRSGFSDLPPVPVSHVGGWNSTDSDNHNYRSGVPRTYAADADIGRRIPAPPGEPGSASGQEYLAGHIIQGRERGYWDFFNPGAYHDPLTEGFDLANQGAIIPVNAIPEKNQLHVLWFRQSDVSQEQQNEGFKPAYWPAVTAVYTLRWPDHPSEIVLASNRGSGPLPSLEARGSIYYQNDKAKPGFNPNEEHALMQGGQAWALRDDLNVTTRDNYTSEPYVLLDYTEGDGRPAMRVFKVLRENDQYKFDYRVEAGTILQPPMPLPLLGVPFGPQPATSEPPISLNTEVGFSIVQSATLEPLPSDQPVFQWVTLTTATEHGFQPFRPIYCVLAETDSRAQTPLGFYPLALGSSTKKSSGIVYSLVVLAQGQWKSAEDSVIHLRQYALDQPKDHNKWRFAIPDDQRNSAIRKLVIVAPPHGQERWKRTFWFCNARVSKDEPGKAFVEVSSIESESGLFPLEAHAATIALVPSADSFAEADFDGSLLGYEPVPKGSGDLKDASFTLQDRRGNIWVYRGPHTEHPTPSMAMQFYYRTLPGFFFPTDTNGSTLAVTNQPEPGTSTCYLRSKTGMDGNWTGPAYHADNNALHIIYHPTWPSAVPILQMGETLTTPKRGLPAIRGQTSAQIVYQQSEHPRPANAAKLASVILHDPTREKVSEFGRKNFPGELGAIPGSVKTQGFRGKTYFPNLPPHLVERFFYDPNRGQNGALVLKGEFVDAPLGEKYLLLNVLTPNDTAELKKLCDGKDNAKSSWDNAIDELTTRMELFVRNPNKPGTYLPSSPVDILPYQPAAVTDDDVAVDSYALTATGPGVGYVTLIAGNGRAFTPEADPISVFIIKVVNTLYRGEVNVVESSNPLNEKLTLQQVVDLAGLTGSYNFEWKIAAPVDGKPPAVYRQTPQTLLADGAWTHFPFISGGESFNTTFPAARATNDVAMAVRAVSDIPFTSVTQQGDRFSFDVPSSALLAQGIHLVIRSANGDEKAGRIHSINGNTVEVLPDANQTVSLTAADIIQLYEARNATAPQSVLTRKFNLDGSKTYSQFWLSLKLDDALGAVVYLDNQRLVQANRGDGDTATTSPPSALNPLDRVYLLPGAAFGDTTTQHTFAVELFSRALPGTLQNFNLRLEAFEVEDVTQAGWIALASPPADGVRAILGGTADVRSLSDNYLIMRYQANKKTHASWPKKPDGTPQDNNETWSQWTEPALAEGWIKRVLKGINPFNQRVTDLFNNQVNTDVSIVSQAGPRWEGDVALNLENINNAGLIEIYETVLKRGKMLSIGGGINYGPANDALLLAAGYLNDLYMMVGNEAWADAANPTIGIGTRDNTYGDIATALFAFKGQLPSLLEEELALLRGRDDFLLPGVELRPLYNRLPWNFTRGIDAGEVIYALNYNILDQNTDGKVDAADAQKLFPQGHGDAYGHYLTALKNYYALLLDPNFDWVPRIEAVTVLGKPVSVDYQDERKFAAAAAAVARAGKQIFDLTWRRDFKFGPGSGWEHLATTKDNTTMRKLPTTRYWGADHWAARTGQGAYVNWIVGNAILPDEDPDPDHYGSIQQVDRTTVPELKELPAVVESLQAAMDNAEGNMTPLGIPASTIPFDLNPLSIANGQNTSHFEQISERAKDAMQNAVVAFDDAKDVTRLMRSEQDSLADFRTEVTQQELSYKNSLVELYGTPYPEDIGPGKIYPTGYDGPDLAHSMYVDNKELKFGDLLDPRQDKTWRIDIQTFPTNSWLKAARILGSTNAPIAAVETDRISDFSFITKAYAYPVDGSNVLPDYGHGRNEGKLWVDYTLDSHGFFRKPDNYVGRRSTPGRIQQGISDIIKARNAAYEAFYKADSAKADLDWAILSLEGKVESHLKIRDTQGLIVQNANGLESTKFALQIVGNYLDATTDQLAGASSAVREGMPKSIIAGLAVGGDGTSAARGILVGTEYTYKSVRDWKKVAITSAINALELAAAVSERTWELTIGDEEWKQELRDATGEMRDKVYGVQNQLTTINAALQELDDAQRAYRSMLAEGERIQAEREVFRQRAAAVVQGFRTRDAAFRIFRNEKLERYKTLFDLAAQYVFMTAQAFDYDTGLLGTQQGREFIDRIIRSRALGVMADGEPQFAGSNTGDPGLSSVMAEMNADWSVLKTRLGIKNPDAYGTTVSLRTECFRILPGTNNTVAVAKWTDQLMKARKANILEDADVRRYCLQVDPKNGQPVPGLILEFSTTVAEGLNLFGRPLAPGDHAFSPASFATKIFGVGVALEGYKGMDDPNANGSAVGESGAASPADPDQTFLDPDAMAATPYLYLIPVGLDSMRSPPLGDTSDIRTWSVDDVAIPLPFNIGGSEHSTAKLWQSSDSLTEPLFAVRKHQPFRPVSSANVFGTLVVYWTGGELERSQYNNTRLLGRSVWNSAWKLVIPGRTLLSNPEDGLDRFIRSVKDVKLYFMTYSYSGN